jgi:hypothetical protein
MRRPLLFLALLAGVFAAATTADALVGSERISPAPAAGKRQLSNPALRVSARVEGLLYPGARLPVTVLVANRRRRPLTIRRARVWVERAPAGCSPASLQFDVFRGYVPLRARGVRQLTLSAVMLPWAQPACQGGVYRLKARARAGPRRRAR